MAKKQLKFSVSQLIIDDSDFSLDTLAMLKENDLIEHSVKHKDQDKPEILSIRKVKKQILEDRFIVIYINQGAKYPYSVTVVDSELEEAENPRPPDLLELNDQFFVLIDPISQRIYLSDLRQRHVIHKWLEDQLGKEVVIKSIIEESEFIEKIRSIKEICFSIEPNLFNSSSEVVLSRALVEDIYALGAKRASLKLDYEFADVTENIKDKFKQIIGQSHDFQNIVVVGRDEEDLETTFNLEEIINKLEIEVDDYTSSKLLDPSSVFGVLMSKIKENEKTA